MTKLYNQYVKTLPRVDGKVFVITGTASGVGFVAAQTVAELGGHVVLLNRKSSRAHAALANLQVAVPAGTFVSIACDLQEFASVRKAATDIKKRYSSIYCLANNAGVMALPDKATVDGYDVQVQTNHLSHFLLTAELWPLLQAGAQQWGEARVVNQSSLLRHETEHQQLEEKYFGRNGGKLGGNSPSYPKGANFLRYHQTKLANAVFTYGLHDKLVQKAATAGTTNRIKSIAAHPGVSKTNLFRQDNSSFIEKAFVALFLFLSAQSPQDGTLGLLKGMVDPNAESGVLYGPKIGKTSGSAVPNPPAEYETDSAAIDMLWKASEKATGVPLAL